MTGQTTHSVDLGARESREALRPGAGSLANPLTGIWGMGMESSADLLVAPWCRRPLHFEERVPTASSESNVAIER